MQETDRAGGVASAIRDTLVGMIDRSRGQRCERHMWQLEQHQGGRKRRALGRGDFERMRGGRPRCWCGKRDFVGRRDGGGHEIYQADMREKYAKVRVLTQ
eukprot:1135306-Rhodomonas_salina.4